MGCGISRMQRGNRRRRSSVVFGGSRARDLIRTPLLASLSCQPVPLFLSFFTPSVVSGSLPTPAKLSSTARDDPSSCKAASASLTRVTPIANGTARRLVPASYSGRTCTRLPPLSVLHTSSLPWFLMYQRKTTNDTPHSSPLGLAYRPLSGEAYYPSFSYACTMLRPRPAEQRRPLFVGLFSCCSCAPCCTPPPSTPCNTDYLPDTRFRKRNNKGGGEGGKRWRQARHGYPP